MDTLPPELLHNIISHIPKRSLPSVRLVSHIFEATAFPLLFRNVLNWLDYETSHRAIMALAQDVYNRPSVMWSPWASEPDGAIEDVWIEIVWRLQMKTPPPGLFISHQNHWGGSKGIGTESREVVEVKVVDVKGQEKLTAVNFARLSGREEMTENRLRTSQNRYLMHRSYCEGFFDGKLEVERKGQEREDAEEDEWKEM